MSNKKNNKIRVGVFISLAFILFIIAILVIGREQNLFMRTVKINTVFRNVHGLKVGNNVRFTGIDIGTVVNMQILTDTSVLVELAIEEDVVPFIRKNSVATIGGEGLMGNKTINLLPGTPDQASIEKGDYIESIEPVEVDAIMNEIKASAEKISKVSDNLISITQKINRGDGIFGKLFADTVFAKNLEVTNRNIRLISGNLVEISDKVNEGKGIFGKMFADTLFSVDLDSVAHNIVTITQNLDSITEKVNQGKGVFGRLFTDTIITHNLYITSQNLKSVSEELNDFSVKLNQRNTVLYKLISDTAFSDSVDITLNRINEGVREATEASKAIQNSGLIRMFSKDEEEKSEENKKNEKSNK